MERPRLLFARLLLVRILVVAHGCSFECLRQRHRTSLVPLCSRRHRLMPAGQSKGSPMGATWSRFPRTSEHRIKRRAIKKPLAAAVGPKARHADATTSANFLRA
jgi:hypothetical protein